MNTLLIVLMVIFGISLPFLLIFGIDYFGHLNFSKERAAEKNLYLTKAEFGPFVDFFQQRKWGKLHDSLFVAEDVLSDPSYMDSWVVQLGPEVLQFGPIDYIRYRLFLKSDEVQAIRSGWRHRVIK